MWSGLQAVVCAEGEMWAKFLMKVVDSAFMSFSVIARDNVPHGDSGFLLVIIFLADGEKQL